MTQFAQSDGFDLPDTLAGDAKLDANFFERAVFTVVQTIA